jgi:hypothetical protein
MSSHAIPNWIWKEKQWNKCSSSREKHTDSLLWKVKNCGSGSSIGIATDYGPDGSGIESRWGAIFRTRPDRPWGPLSLLYNWYRVFPGGEAAGAWCWPPTSFLRRGQERIELYLYPLSRPVRPETGTLKNELCRGNTQKDNSVFLVQHISGINMPINSSTIWRTTAFDVQHWYCYLGSSRAGLLASGLSVLDPRRQYKCWSSNAVVRYTVLLMMGILMPETCWAYNT